MHEVTSVGYVPNKTQRSRIEVGVLYTKLTHGHFISQRSYSGGFGQRAQSHNEKIPGQVLDSYALSLRLDVPSTIIHHPSLTHTLERKSTICFQVYDRLTADTYIPDHESRFATLDVGTQLFGDVARLLLENNDDLVIRGLDNAALDIFPNGQGFRFRPTGNNDPSSITPMNFEPMHMRAFAELEPWEKELMTFERAENSSSDYPWIIQSKQRRKAYLKKRFGSNYESFFTD